MGEMINRANNFLELIINAVIVIGIIKLACFYWRLKRIDLKIEVAQKDFEQKRNTIRRENAERGIPEKIMDSQINQFKIKTDEYLAPLIRERERIVSEIPFLK